jgi:hypothetical protein
MLHKKSNINLRKKIMKFVLGDIVTPIVGNYTIEKYQVLDIFVSEKSGEVLLQVGFIQHGDPKNALVSEAMFKHIEVKEKKNED